MANKDLQEKIRSLLFEDVWQKYGSEYMSHPQDQETTVPEDLPVAPTDMMATQLAVDKPPIEDDEFMPDGVEELSRAASALADQVPAGQVEFFYELMKKNLDAAMEKENDTDAGSPTEEEEEEEAAQAERESETGFGADDAGKSFLENRLRVVIQKINEITDWSQKEDDDWDDLDAADKAAWEAEFGSDRPEGDGPKKPTIKPTVKGKYIAPYYEKSGPAGVNVTTDRLMQNFLRPMMELPPGEVEEVVEYLQHQFKIVARKLGEDPKKMSRDLPQTFSGLLIKDIVKKATRGGKELGSLQAKMMNRWRSMSDKEKESWFQKAVDEAASEEAAWDALVAQLEDEDPAQLEVLRDLNLK
tara:strand:- start:1802 stop:2875 length:1074 start_codon:yes stop_codon:yes gene_type:complete